MGNKKSYLENRDEQIELLMGAPCSFREALQDAYDRGFQDGRLENGK